MSQMLIDAAMRETEWHFMEQKLSDQGGLSRNNIVNEVIEKVR